MNGVKTKITVKKHVINPHPKIYKMKSPKVSGRILDILKFRKLVLL